MTSIEPAVSTKFLDLSSPFTLSDGQLLNGVCVAYETYGELDDNAGNAVLLFHALSGSQHAWGWNPDVPGTHGLWKEENHTGWWNHLIGPGKPFDTDQYFVVCANYLGGCYGTTGPMSPHPDDGGPWGSRFPAVTIQDQAAIQARLLDALGIERAAVAGPSVGGLAALSFAVQFPERTKCVISIGSGYKASIEQRLSLFEQALAIELDPNFNVGDYYGGEAPKRGLALARIIGHKSFVYQEGLEARARKEIGNDCGMLSWTKLTRSTQSYMLHQGTKFAERFDANTYLRVVNMWAEFDIREQEQTDSFTRALMPCARGKVPFLVFSIDTDCCFKQAEQEDFHQQLLDAGVPSEFHLVHSGKGHDSFLLEPELYADAIGEFLRI